MMGDMKRLTNLALCIAMFALCAIVPISSAHAEIFGVKTVYLLPMAGGLDQYLALQLSSGGLLQVVTDPNKADAILTDSIGTRLEDTTQQIADIEAEIRKIIPRREVSAIVDSLGIPQSSINQLYNSTGIIGTQDTDVFISLADGHHSRCG